MDETKFIVDPGKQDNITGNVFGYYYVLRKAGRDRYGIQRYQCRCLSCKREYIRTLEKIKAADGLSECKHTTKTRKPAVAEYHPCDYCGEPTRNFRFCCASCKTKWVNENTKKKPTKPCEWCGETTPNHRSRFCGNKCKCAYNLLKRFGIDVRKDDI